MAQVARWFGESDHVDFDESLNVYSTSVTPESLTGKLDNKEEMKKIAESLANYENYEGAQRLWDHIDAIDKIKNSNPSETKNLKAKMLNEQQIVDLLSSLQQVHKQPTLRFVVNQVLYRVDDAVAQHFVSKFIERYQKIDDRDYDQKINLKKRIMIEGLILLKVNKIGIEEYKYNWDELVPFIIREIEENLILLNELKTQEEDILDALKAEEKFNVFLKGVKALFQILTNIHESVELMEPIDTRYAMDIEVFCQELTQGLKTMHTILKILEDDFGISQGLMKPSDMKERILNNEAAIEEGFTAVQKDKYNNIWSLCATYVHTGDDRDQEKQELHLPERRLVFNNMKEEQQTYHNYCINLWINKISANPN